MRGAVEMILQTFRGRGRPPEGQSSQSQGDTRR